jgi:hypothetical protein
VFSSNDDQPKHVMNQEKANVKKKVCAMVKTSNYQSHIKTLLRLYTHNSHSNGTKRVTRLKSVMKNFWIRVDHQFCGITAKRVKSPNITFQEKIKLSNAYTVMYLKYFIM